MTRSLLAPLLPSIVLAGLLCPSPATAQQAGVKEKPYYAPEPPDSLLQAISSLPQQLRTEILQAFQHATGVTIRDFVNPTCVAYSFWKWRTANPGPPTRDPQQLIAQWGGWRGCLDAEIIARSHSEATSQYISNQPGMTIARRDAIGACVGNGMVKETMVPGATAATPVNFNWLQQRYVGLITECMQKFPASAAASQAADKASAQPTPVTVNVMPARFRAALKPWWQTRTGGLIEEVRLQGRAGFIEHPAGGSVVLCIVEPRDWAGHLATFTFSSPMASSVHTLGRASVPSFRISSPSYINVGVAEGTINLERDGKEGLKGKATVKLNNRLGQSTFTTEFYAVRHPVAGTSGGAEVCQAA